MDNLYIHILILQSHLEIAISVKTIIIGHVIIQTKFGVWGGDWGKTKFSFL